MERMFLLILGCLAMGCERDLMGVARARHAHDFHCDASEIKVKHTAHDTYRAYGCGATAMYGCYVDDGDNGRCASPVRLLRSRHASRYQCDPEGVFVKYDEGDAWKVDGCGHTTTYVCTLKKRDDYRCIVETVDHGE